MTQIDTLCMYVASEYLLSLNRGPSSISSLQVPEALRARLNSYKSLNAKEKMLDLR